MAIRRPMKMANGNLRDMTSLEVDALIEEAIRQYGNNPSRLLSVSNSGGNLGAITDTRLQAGAYATGTASAPTEAGTPDVSTVSVAYDRLSEVSSGAAPVFGNSAYSYPIYRSGGNLVAMSKQDWMDTIINPAIEKLVLGTISTSQAGTYFISSNVSESGSTLISNTPVFVDTRADAAEYTVDGIGEVGGEVQDQPTTITSYFLHQINPATSVAYTPPVIYRESDKNLQAYPKASLATALQNTMRNVTETVTNYRLRYSFTSGTSRGTGMANTKLDGSSYNTKFVSADDYRAQEFPAGAVTTSTTYFLKIFKE